jgi:hypothetical protein
MRCSPGVICNVIGEMSKALKGRIQELGFVELLKLKIDKLDDRAIGFFSAELCSRKSSENSDWEHAVADHSRSCASSIWTVVRINALKVCFGD